MVQRIAASRPVSEQPYLALTNWRVFESDGTRHFVGVDPSVNAGRVSSPIKTYDKQHHLGKTATGRLYLLNGPPGQHELADEIWAVYEKLYNLPGHVDVTDEYINNPKGLGNGL